MREPVLSVSACVEQDEQDNTTIAPFQIFDLSGAKISISHSVLDTPTVMLNLFPLLSRIITRENCVI